MALTYQINAQKFKGGVQAGLLLTQVDGDDFNGYHKMGAFVGGFANIPFEEKKYNCNWKSTMHKKAVVQRWTIVCIKFASTK